MTERLTNAEAARLRVRLVAQLIVGISCPIAGALLGALLASNSPAVSLGVAAWLIKVVPPAWMVDKVFGDGTIARLVSLPASAGFFIGCALAWLARGPVKRLADGLYLPLDTELFRPVQRAGALDPLWAPADPRTGIGMQAITWAEPPAPHDDHAPSPRRLVWDRLVAFLSDDVGDGRFTLLGQPRAQMERFRWILVTGQPGSGKTRMAMQLARDRARRDVLGDPPKGCDRVRRREHRQASSALNRGAWRRIITPWSARREGAGANGTPWGRSDPWDAWWLVSTGASGRPSHMQGAGFDPGIVKRLAAWRPRRPTVLLLDDPRQGDAERVIGALLEAEARFRHPVRLLVVNQAVPADLKTHLRSGVWTSDLRGFANEILKLDGAAAIGPGEVRMMASSLEREMEAFYRQNPIRRQRIVWKSDDRSVDLLLRRTAGNALLVALALYHVYRHPERPEVSRAALLDERVEQITAALSVAGIGDDRQLAIAWATLVGPGAALPATMRTDQRRFDPETIRMVPNLYPSSPPSPPLVQPEPIGDAFVRNVLADTSCAPDRRRQVLADAWQAAPAAMLRAAWRLSVGEDALAVALREGPPAEAVLDDTAMALAQAQWAMHIPRSEWDLGDVPGPAPAPPVAGYGGTPSDREERDRFAALRDRADSALRLALERVRGLSPDDAAKALGPLVPLLGVDNTVAIVRGTVALALFAAVVGRALEHDKTWRDRASAIEAVASLREFFLAMPRWIGNAPLEDAEWSSWVFGDLVRRAAAAFTADADGVARAEALALVADRSTMPGPAAAIFAALATLADLDGAKAGRYAAAAAAYGGDADAACRAASRVDDIARPFAGNREFERERARAWCHVAYARGEDRSGCEAAAGLVDAIARPFTGDRDFEHERATAWCHVAYARREDRAGCEAAAGLVDAIARPFTGDRDFERERARAWCHVAYARREDRAGCEAAAGLVDDIARPFAGDRDFERERARAWCHVAYARREDRAGCEAAAGLVDDIARPFAGNREFERERARAWCHVAYARGEDRSGCEAAAGLVDAIARPFTGDRDFEHERATAWCHVAYARREDRAGCEAVAHLVDAIARPFTGDRDFERERARAWRYVAYARGEDRAGCEAAAGLVDNIARPFAGDRDFERERAEAWRCIAYARREDRAGCEAAARLVDDIARPFAGDRDFEHERATAWRYVAYARREDRAGCEAAAGLVDDIARPFAGDRDFVHERATAWRFVGRAPPGQ